MLQAQRSIPPTKNWQATLQHWAAQQYSYKSIKIVHPEINGCYGDEQINMELFY
jgi:hypothetical protein